MYDNTEGYDERVDLWALGVVMYECLTGVNPFKAEMLADTEELIKTKTIDCSDPNLSKVSFAGRKFLLHLLTRDPDKRMTI